MWEFLRMAHGEGGMFNHLGKGTPEACLEQWLQPAWLTSWQF